MKTRWAYRNKYNGTKTKRGYIPSPIKFASLDAHMMVKEALWDAIRAKETRMGTRMSEWERLNLMLTLIEVGSMARS